MSDPSTGSGQDKPTCPRCGSDTILRGNKGNWDWVCGCSISKTYFATEAEALAAARRRAPVLTKEEADAISTCITGYSALLSDMLRITGSTVCLEGPVKAELERLAAKIRELSEGVE